MTTVDDAQARLAVLVRALIHQLTGDDQCPVYVALQLSRQLSDWAQHERSEPIAEDLLDRLGELSHRRDYNMSTKVEFTWARTVQAASRLSELTRRAAGG